MHKRLGAIRQCSQGGQNAKFIRRFQQIERALNERGSSLSEASIEEMEALWQEAKRQ